MDSLPSMRLSCKLRSAGLLCAIRSENYMRDAVAVAATSVPSNRDWFGLAWKSIAWGVLLASIAYYVRRDDLHYLFRYTPESFKAFWPDRILIRTHVTCAIIMIFTGPFQFWTGFRMRYLTLHRWLGRIFL